MKFIVGKYIPNDSVIHKLDPRIKVLVNFLLIIMIFMVDNYLTFAIIFLPCLICYFSSKLTFRRLFAMLKPVIFITIFLFLINVFFITPGQLSKNRSKDWFTTINLWEFNISSLALERTLIISTRIYLMIIITTILTSTTKPTDLTRGLEDLMSPLKLIKFPVHIIAMIISIALRFVPTLLEESQKIMKAQASRGVDFKHGNFKSKIKSIVTLIIPLFVIAFSKADDLSNAMETRGYDPYAKRSQYRKYSITIYDVGTLFVFVSLISLLIVFDYVPNLLPTWWI